MGISRGPSVILKALQQDFLIYSESNGALRRSGRKFLPVPPAAIIPVSMTVPGVAIPITASADIDADDRNSDDRSARSDGAAASARVIIAPVAMRSVTWPRDTYADPDTHLRLCGRRCCQSEAAGRRRPDQEFSYGFHRSISFGGWHLRKSERALRLASLIKEPDGQSLRHVSIHPAHRQAAPNAMEKKIPRLRPMIDHGAEVFRPVIVECAPPKARPARLCDVRRSP